MNNYPFEDGKLEEEAAQTQLNLAEKRVQTKRLEELNHKLTHIIERQNRFLQSRDYLRAHLPKTVTKIESEQHHLAQRIALLEEVLSQLNHHKETLVSLNPEHWNNERLEENLLQALAQTEQIEQDLLQGCATLGWDNPEDEKDTSPLKESDILLWLKRGFLFTAPLNICLLILFFLSRLL